MTSERIAAGIAQLEAATFGPEWEEFAVPAANEQCQTLEAMRTLHAQALGREQEAARQELIRLENERVAKELAAERARIAEESAAIRRQHDAQQAELKRQADELAAQRAEADHLQRVAEAQRQAIQEAAERASNQRERDAYIAANPPAPLYPTAAANAPNTAGQPTQQVLKAEPATTDATDRVTAADTSPRVGAMGAGQAADAAPVEEPTPPPPTELQALAAEARASRFPSQPKMGAEWWVRFYALADAT